MSVRRIGPEDSLGRRRGEVVVCIPVYGAHAQFVDCLSSVLAHTPADVPILVCDDASPDLRSEQHVRELSTEHELLYLRREQNVGFPANVNGAFAAAAPADVVVLNSDCLVADGWVEGLRAAAYCDSTVATASALSNNASVLTVPDLDEFVWAEADFDHEPEEFPLPDPVSFYDAARAVRERSLRLRPRLLTAVGHCMYVRRTALELVGDFDIAFSPGYGEEVDFSQRCLHAGLCHVAADDVFVLHHGGASLAVDGAPNPIKRANEDRLAARFPYYHLSVEANRLDPTGPLADALLTARRALRGLSVAIDARILTGPMTGTQLYVLEMVAAVARTGEVQVIAIIPDALSPYARRALDALPSVMCLPAAIALAGLRADVVHRPYHVSTPAELTFLAQLGDRLVLTHHDLISYRNPGYFGSFVDWEQYRALTRRTMSAVDRVVFVSAHARDDALAEQMVEAHRTCVVHNGVDHSLTAQDDSPAPPRAAGGLPDDLPAILCLGTDFRHKNRLFALRVLDELRRRHGWNGRLVLAGPRVAHGSTAAEEEELLRVTPELAEAVLDLGPVSEAEKAWLLGRASLVIYPTVHEGFGLIPFEATEHGVPCLWAPGTSLGEVLPESAAGIVAWDAAATADHAIELMRDGSARDQLLSAVREAAVTLRWDAAGRRLAELYQQVCAEPASPAVAWERARGSMRRGLSDDAIRLMGPEGVMPSDLERPLLALATHPQIGQPVFGLLRAGYRASARLRRLAGRGARRSLS